MALIAGTEMGVIIGVDISSDKKGKHSIRQKFEFVSHNGPVTAIGHNEECGILATGGTDEVLNLFCTKLGKQIESVRVSDDPLTSIEVSKRGLIFSGDSSGRMWIHEIKNSHANLLKSIKLKSPIDLLSCNPSGTALVTVSTKSFKLWDTTTLMCVNHTNREKRETSDDGYPSPSVLSVQWFNDEEFMVLEEDVITVVGKDTSVILLKAMVNSLEISMNTKNEPTQLTSHAQGGEDEVRENDALLHLRREVERCSLKFTCSAIHRTANHVFIGDNQGGIWIVQKNVTGISCTKRILIGVGGPRIKGLAVTKFSSNLRSKDKYFWICVTPTGSFYSARIAESSECITHEMITEIRSKHRVTCT